MRKIRLRKFFKLAHHDEVCGYAQQVRYFYVLVVQQRQCLPRVKSSNNIIFPAEVESKSGKIINAAGMKQWHNRKAAELSGNANGNIGFERAVEKHSVRNKNALGTTRCSRGDKNRLSAIHESVTARQ